MARKEEQFDPYEFGARNADPELGAFQPLPPAPKRIKPMHLLFAFLGAVVLLAVVQNGRSRNGPPLAGNCVKAAFAFDTSDVRTGGVVSWSAVGPASSTVVFGLGTSTVPTTAGQGKLAGPVSLAGCAASGRFGVNKPAGDYVVTAFSVAADGTVTTVGTATLAVSAK